MEKEIRESPGVPSGWVKWSTPWPTRPRPPNRGSSESSTTLYLPPSGAPTCTPSLIIVATLLSDGTVCIAAMCVSVNGRVLHGQEWEACLVALQIAAGRKVEHKQQRPPLSNYDLLAVIMVSCQTLSSDAHRQAQHFLCPRLTTVYEDLGARTRKEERCACSWVPAKETSWWDDARKPYVWSRCIIPPSQSLSRLMGIPDCKLNACQASPAPDSINDSCLLQTCSAGALHQPGSIVAGQSGGSNCSPP